MVKMDELKELIDVLKSIDKTLKKMELTIRHKPSGFGVG